MKKKFLAFCTLLMVLVIGMAIIACTDYNKEETPDEEKTSTTTSYTDVVKNGTFYDVSSTAGKGVYDVLNGWTISNGSLTKPDNGEDLTERVFAAALDLSDTEKAKSIFETYKIALKESTGDEVSDEELPEEQQLLFANPGVDSANTPQVDKRDSDGNVITGDGAGKENLDNNALLLASSNKSGSIYAASSDFTLDKNSVYKFQFSVCTLVENENSGAFVYIRGAMQKDYIAINTNNQWVTKTLYIETNRDEDMKLSVQLWLGYGPGKSSSSSYATDGKDKYATRGFALFDNVICTKMVQKPESESTEMLFPAYNEGLTIHENFGAFKVANPTVDTYSAYYLLDADFAVRTALTSTTNENRKYYYSFRDFSGSSGSNLNESYWKTVDNMTANEYQYGIVNPTYLYESDSSINYKTYSSTNSMTISDFMSHANWQSKVMTEEFKDKDEQYVLMFFNKTLGTSGAKSTGTVTIDSNKYYRIGVWAYVWETANPEYTLTKDPHIDTTYSTTKRVNLYLFEKYDASEVHILKDAYPDDGISAYYSDLTQEEKADANTFSDDFMTTYKNNHTTEYNTLITTIQSWLKGNNMNLNEDVVDSSSATSFLYTYLYYSYLGNGTVIGTLRYSKDGDEASNVIKLDGLFGEAYTGEKSCLRS